MPPLLNANERDYETIYSGKEGAKHNIKFWRTKEWNNYEKSFANEWNRL